MSLPEEHFHAATDGPPGRRTAPPCHCDTPSAPERPWAGQGFNGPPAQPDPQPQYVYCQPCHRHVKRAGYGEHARQHHQPPLRQALRKQFRLQHAATLADLEAVFRGTDRRKLIDTLAAMRDDGEVRFQGPRYVWAENP